LPRKFTRPRIPRQTAALSGFATEAQRHRDKEEKEGDGIRGRVEQFNSPSNIALFFFLKISVPLWLIPDTD
jgi:hypothetical protein